ncbi:MULTISPECIES: hypothetical protein [unclassified Streptomyces]|uniref:hypothetical protein n=1 Tax=unclassified Streptomyces TaxID=2593676 RepID=UPI0037F702BD
MVSPGPVSGPAPGPFPGSRSRTPVPAYGTAVPARGTGPGRPSGRGGAVRPLAGLLLAAALLALTGCASTVDPIERLGRRAAEEMGSRHAPAAGARASTAPAPAAPTRAVPASTAPVPAAPVPAAPVPAVPVPAVPVLAVPAPVVPAVPSAGAVRSTGVAEVR